MPRSINDLHCELITNGKVRIPQLTVASIISMITGPVAIVLLGMGLLWIVPDSSHYGPVMVAISLFASALIVLWLVTEDLRRGITVTCESLQHGKDHPIPWSDIQKISTPISRGFLSIQLSADGYLRHGGDADPDEDMREFLQSGEDRVLAWQLSEEISPEELRFLRDQLRPRT